MKQDDVTGQNIIGDKWCYYYLHENGDLIHKHKDYEPKDFEDSGFVKKWWRLDLTNRADAYNMLIHANMLGAQKERIAKLAERWGITDEDAKIFCQKVGLVQKMDGNLFCVEGKDFINPQESNQGFGDTLFKAICEFCRLEVL